MYLKRCLKIRCDFTYLFYLGDGMAREDTRALEKQISCIISKKWHKEYSEMVGFVRSCLYLEVVRYNALLLKGQRRNKGLL